VDGQSDTSTEITGTETDNGRRMNHWLKDPSSLPGALD